MNLLIVDNQSAADSLVNSVSFEKVHINHVYSAYTSADAGKILRKYPIHIILCNSEMSGKDGLSFHAWALKHYPETICILILPHADLSRVKEGVKLGCFDFLVRPFLSDEAAECLERATKKVKMIQEKQEVYNLGKIYIEHSTELTDRVIFNLYSSSPDDHRTALELLNQMGHPVSDKSLMQLIIIDIYSFYPLDEKQPSYTLLGKQITSCLSTLPPFSSIYSLMTRNKFRQFVLILYCNDQTLLQFEKRDYQNLYDAICAAIGIAPACYVSDYALIHHVRAITHELHMYMSDNVSPKSGLFLSAFNQFSSEALNFSDYMRKWKAILYNEQPDLLLENILCYLELISSVRKANFKSLCDFHQQLTHLLFNYANTKEIEISRLFTKDVTYSDYMESYKNISSFKQALTFLITSLFASMENPNEKTDVEKAKDYILNNITQNVSVKEVSNYVHLSPEYFTKLFKKETGQNIKHYIMQVKIDHAKTLLSTPLLPISLVSLELGYTNFSHFTQMFKKYEGITPSEYRRKMTGQEY